MGKSGKKRKKKTIGYNKLGMFGISLIVLILILTLMAQSRDLKESLAGYETRAEALSQQIEEEKARTQEIEDLKQYMLTDEYACLLYTSGLYHQRHGLQSKERAGGPF